MNAPDDQPLMREVDITTARNLRRVFDEAIRAERPVMIVRNERERGVLLSREQQLRLLESYQLHVTVLPEEEVGGFTLWIRELNIGAYGLTLLDARAKLLETVRSYVRHFVDQWDFYRQVPETAAQEPYVYRLSLATGDSDLIGMLFKSDAPTSTMRGNLSG